LIFPYDFGLRRSQYRQATTLAYIGKVAKSKAPVELVISQPIKELVIAAAEQEKCKAMSAENWKKNGERTGCVKEKMKLQLT